MLGTVNAVKQQNSRMKIHVKGDTAPRGGVPRKTPSMLRSCDGDGFVVIQNKTITPSTHPCRLAWAQRRARRGTSGHRRKQQQEQQKATAADTHRTTGETRQERRKRDRNRNSREEQRDTERQKQTTHTHTQHNRQQQQTTATITNTTANNSNNKHIMIIIARGAGRRWRTPPPRGWAS